MFIELLELFLDTEWVKYLLLRSLLSLRQKEMHYLGGREVIGSCYNILYG